MPKFIDNLVHKAFGSSLLTKPEPSIVTGYDIFSHNFVMPGERSVVESSPDFPVNSSESVNATKTTSDESSSISGIKFQASSGETYQKPLKKTSVSVTGMPAQQKISQLGKHIEDLSASSKSDHVSVSSKSVDNSVAAERQSSNSMDAEKKNFDKTVEHFEASTSKFGRFPKPQPASDNTGNEFQVDQPAPELPPASDKFSLSRKDEIHVVNVEPVVAAQQQAFIQELIRKTTSAVLPFSAKGMDVKTSRAQLHKEVKVNIGRIEIKASRPASPPVKPPPRGFGDHIMMRLYLDRHYF